MTSIDDRPPTVDEEPPWLDDLEPPDRPTPQPATPSTRDTRALPNDAAAEAAVLGAAMIHPGALDDLSRIVTAPDFYRPDHEHIWRTLTHLRGTDQPTAATAVVAHLIDTGNLRHAGGGPYIVDLMHAAPITTDEAIHYAHRIDQLARRRTAITLVDHGLQKLRSPGPETDVDQVLNTITTELVQARDDLANPPTATTWAPVDLGPVLAGEHLDPPPTMLMRTDGVYLLYEGAIHTISGESESGKTWLTLIAALQLIQDNRRVVFLDFEDRAERVIGRLLALGAHPTQIRDHFAYVRPDRPLDDEGRTQLAPALDDVALVILDGVTEAMTTHGFDLNSNADSALFQALIPRWVADHGPAVVMIDHVVKNKEEQGRFALGAQHKLAGIDGVAYLVKMIQPFSRGKRGLARVEIAKDRPGHVREQATGKTIAEFSLDATAGDLVLLAHLTPPDAGRAPGEAFEPTALMEKISRYVQLNPGMSKKAIEGAMNGKATTIRLALELLVSRQYVGVKTGARGAVQHFHHKAYYQSDDTTGDDSESALVDPAEETA